MLYDALSVLNPKRGISPVSVADTTPQVSAIIDSLGHSSATWFIALGSIADADATFAVLVEEGDDSGLSDAAAVADADLLGTEALAGFQFDDDNKVRKIGYRGTKRYHRLTITPTANSSAALLCAICVLGHPMTAPTANPPV